LCSVSEAEGDSQQTYRRVADWLRRLDAELKAADRAEGTSLEEEMLSLHDELEELGLVQLLTAAESVPIAPDNLPDTLSDVGQGGVADVVHLAGVDLAAHDLLDEPGLPFARLPSPNFGRLSSGWSDVRSLAESVRSGAGGALWFRCW
jgi:hypothetical protein